jgi:hypothetical protein
MAGHAAASTVTVQAHQSRRLMASMHSILVRSIPLSCSDELVEPGTVIAKITSSRGFPAP